MGKRGFSHACTNCQVTETPQWREGPEGPKTLCNACGVKWYRQSKKPTKGGVGRKRIQHHRMTHWGLHGDSGDEVETYVQLSASDMDEESEERDAAISLLSFAGVEPPGDYQPCPSLLQGEEGIDRISATLITLSSVLSSREMECLQRLHSAACNANREAQAATAATIAVAQFLNDKLQESKLAQSRMEMAENMLLEELANMTP